MKLNLGSYTRPKSGWHNVDVVDFPGVDEIYDLNVVPWPWRNVEQVCAIDIIEHLGGLTKVEVVRQLAEITSKGAQVEIRVPCGSHPWAWASIQHAHLFWFNSFEVSYAQPYFRCDKIWAGLLDRHFSVPYVGLTRPFLKLLARLTLVQSIRFHLTRI